MPFLAPNRIFRGNQSRITANRPFSRFGGLAFRLRIVPGFINVAAVSMAVETLIMRKLFLRALFFLIPFLYSIYVSSQPKKERDCSTTCFSSEVVKTEKISATCTSYELNVSISGECAHALSHFTVAIPCGTIQKLWNSENWAQQIGADPTSGLNGFKIDDISGFGDGNLESFTVRFILCAAEENCRATLGCWQPQVAYKASTCVNYETLSISCKSALSASLQKTDASCFGARDGSLSLIIDDGEEPYDILWSDQSTGLSLAGLAAGAYSVVVRDQSGAEIVLEETITQAEAIAVSGSSTPASCSGAADGTIDINVSGGTGQMRYTWSDGSETEDLQSLASGSYTVTVTDENNCTATARFTVGTLSTVDINGTHVKPDCNTANGSIDITITGGSEPFSFIWSNGATTEDLSDIGPGFYTVTVADAGGCSQEASFFIKDNNTLLLKAISEPAGCNDEPTGSIDLTVTGGTAPYTYSWSNSQIEEDPSGLKSGYHTVKITDQKGCTATAGFSVSQSTFQVPKTVIHPACHGDENGSITLGEPIGGTGPFSFQWSVVNETGSALTGLGAGIYSVTITDATGCSRTLSTTINEPAQITVSASITNSECGVEGGYAIDLEVTGGTAPYSYKWSDDSTVEDPSGLESGTHVVTITDAHGCSTTEEVVIEDASGSWSCLIGEPASSPVCGSTNNILSTNMSDAESYSWQVESSDGNWSITGAETPTITFTAGGENSSATFTLTIAKDGCTQTCTYTASVCAPDDGGAGEDPDGGDPDSENPGEENPGGEDPDGENPGGEEPDGGNQACSECFESMVKAIEVSGGCRTYEIEVNANGFCRHDLSHWTLAIPCGSISEYSNSEGWKMLIGKDPTTGLYGLKVDDISDFGKREDAFTVRFTLCSTSSCDLSDLEPVVAYKAGQCVAFETTGTTNILSEEAISVYPNPFSEAIHFEWTAKKTHVNLQIIDQYGNIVTSGNAASVAGNPYAITLETSHLPRGMYYYRLTADGKTHHGKISKR